MYVKVKLLGGQYVISVKALELYHIARDIMGNKKEGGLNVNRRERVRA